MVQPNKENDGICHEPKVFFDLVGGVTPVPTPTPALPPLQYLAELAP